MSSAAAAATRAFGVDRGHAVPVRRHRRRRRGAAGRQQPGRHHAAGHAVLPARPRARAPCTSWSTRAAPPPRSSRTGTCSRCRTPTCRWPTACCTSRSGTAWSTRRYIADRTTGFDAVRRAVRSDWPDRVERTTGIAVAELTAVVHELAAARTAMILTARGAEQHADGTDTTTAWINLALALGLPGRGPGSGCSTVTGQGNGQGGREHGQKADQLPGYRKLADPADRAHVAAVWGIDPDELPGPGRLGLRAAGPPRHRRRGAGAAGRRVQPGGLRARTPGTSPSASTRWTSWSSATSSCPRPRAGPTSCCPPPSGRRRTAR